MRTNHSMFLTLGLLVIALGAHSTGCFDSADDCEESLQPPCYPGPTGGSGGSGGGTPAGCVPSENADPVGDECGVFVSSSMGNDMNGGTKGEPFRTIGAALAAASGKPVYACAEAFEEAVVLSGAVDLYGGLDCLNGWAYVGAATKTALTAPTDTIPLIVHAGASGSGLEDFAIRATDAVLAGGSSIAVVVDGAAAEFRRCDFEAGRGAAGNNGDSPPAAVAKAVTGDPGGDACSDPVEVNGGSATANPDCMDSVGGSGGDGVSVGNGVNGSVGLPENALNGGAGEGALVCVAGTAGDPGMSGMPGAAATERGSLTATGYTGADGGNGGPGTIAQGGGGGGGAKGGLICTAALTAGAGASGGSGGPGGCGGLGGQGGGGRGGHSLGIAHRGEAPTQDGVTFVHAPMGGPGGDGGTAGAVGDVADVLSFP